MSHGRAVTTRKGFPKASSSRRRRSSRDFASPVNTIAGNASRFLSIDAYFSWFGRLEWKGWVWDKATPLPLILSNHEALTYHKTTQDRKTPHLERVTAACYPCMESVQWCRDDSCTLSHQFMTEYYHHFVSDQHWPHGQPCHPFSNSHWLLHGEGK
ncbi:hypothetical protein SESBI_41015 [Sesbania bispinosa]|nr:hypothetical protein SESBI_41015 [Sesbania bispinosa]